MVHGGPPVIAKRDIFEYDFWRFAMGQCSAQNTPAHSASATGATIASRSQADILKAGIGVRNRASGPRARAFSRIAAHGGAGAGAVSDMQML